MNYDGWVTISTKLDTKQLEKDLKSSKRKLEQYEKEAERLTKTQAKADADLSSYREEVRLLEELQEADLKMVHSAEERQNVLRNTQTLIGEIEKKYEKELSNYDSINKKIQENAHNQGILKERIDETNKSLEKAKKIASIKDITESIGKSTSKILKTVVRWGLAIFSVRTAYSLIRRAMSSVVQYNEQIGTDLEYMQYAMGTAIEPVVRSLVSLAYSLMQYVNQISIALFNYNLFLNASVENFNKMNKSANALKKSLAGFDEMNVLGGSNTGNLYTPNLDLSQSQPEQVEEVKNFWDTIFEFWEEDWAKFFTNIGGKWGSFIEGLGTILKGFYDVFKGIFQLIAGLIEIFVGIFTGNLDKMEHGWKTMCDGLKNIIIGALEIIGGAILGALGFVKGLFLEVVDFIYKMFVLPVINFFTGIGNNIKTTFDNVVSGIKGKMSSIASFINEKVVIPVTNVLNKMWTDLRSAPINFVNFVGEKMKSMVNKMIDALNWLIRQMNKLSFDVPDWVPWAGGDTWGINIKEIPRLAVGGIVNLPSKGVPVGGARTGESGAEGVIPLTDSQAMETLGEAIGRYITINANITNTMNGRVISRELQKINNNSDFAFNK